MIKKLLSFITFLFWVSMTFAQNSASAAKRPQLIGPPEKYLVVVAVLLVIFVGILFYLISIDRKVKKLEKLSKE